MHLYMIAEGGCAATVSLWESPELSCCKVEAWGFWNASPLRGPILSPTLFENPRNPSSSKYTLSTLIKVLDVAGDPPLYSTTAPAGCGCPKILSTVGISITFYIVGKYQLGVGWENHCCCQIFLLHQQLLSSVSLTLALPLEMESGLLHPRKKWDKT